MSSGYPMTPGVPGTLEPRMYLPRGYFLGIDYLGKWETITTKTIPRRLRFAETALKRSIIDIDSNQKWFLSYIANAVLQSYGNFRVLVNCSILQVDYKLYIENRPIVMVLY